MGARGLTPAGIDGSTGSSGTRGAAAATAALIALAAVAWVATAVRMAGMDAGPGTDPGSLGFYITTWIVMMAAMMLPTTAPAVLGRFAPRFAPGPVASFVAGYLLVWAAAGLVAYAALRAGRAFAGDLFAWDRAGRWTAAGVLALAAAYELTPIKAACLARCRTCPGAAGGRLAGLRAGTANGAWCAGCCWGLMAALFALGAMSLVWMAVIATIVTAQKLLRAHSRAAVVAVAVVLAALACGLAIAPASVPGLTVPGSPAAMRAMSGHM